MSLSTPGEIKRFCRISILSSEPHVSTSDMGGVRWRKRKERRGEGEDEERPKPE